MKFDGFRALAYVRGGECRLVSRNGNDLTGRFAGGREGDRQGVKSPNAVARRRDLPRSTRPGRTSFSELQQGTGPLVFYAFDLLELDGEPLVDLPLDRAQGAAARSCSTRASRPSRLSEDFDDGDALFEVAQAQGLEGIIAKRADSTLQAGQAHARLAEDQDARTTRSSSSPATRAAAGRRAGTFGALVLAVQRRRRAALRRQRRHRVRRRRDRQAARGCCEPLRRDTSPLRGRAEDAARPQGRRAVGRAAARRAGAVRRVDARRPPAPPRLPRHPRGQERGRGDARAADRRRDPAPGKRELRLSNLDKPFWPDEGITKGDLLRYYQAVAPVLVPHLKDRPFTMRRYPDGAYGKAFFQKDAPTHMPDWIPTLPRARLDPRQGAHEEVGRVPGRQRRARAALDGEHGLHRHEHVVLARRQARPPRLRALRPRPDARGAVGADDRGGADPQGAARPARARRRSRRPRAARASTCSCRSTAARRSRQSRAFSEIVAGAIARAHPKLATTEWSKARRRGVLIDSNQNGEGKTIASRLLRAAEAERARSRRRSRWDEVDDKLNPSIYTMPVVLERVQHARRPLRRPADDAPVALEGAQALWNG